LSRGQIVTVRGIASDADSASVAGLLDAKVTSVGESTAKAKTVAALVAFWADEEKKGEFRDLDVVVRVKVVEAMTGEKDHMVVTDPDDARSPQFRLNRPTQAPFSKELAALKPGDVAIVMGQPARFSQLPALDQPRVLTHPPKGVKLPGDKP
jgi:hypothetical protein